MQKVIAINLNGHAYQLDESAYDALRAYLDRADVQLKDNPDRAEIVSDLEQAIADKCNKFIGPHKTVVTAAEIEQVVKEMGPVEGAEEARDHREFRGENEAGKEAETGGNATGAAVPKRLYRIPEGQMIAGVCTGLAAFFNIDATFIRIPFLLLALFTNGWFVVVYIALAFVIPDATTSEERAAAHGQPFNAQELIDQAKRNFADFRDNKQWRRHWRQQQRQWRAQWRRAMREQRWWGPWGPGVHPSVGYATRVWARLMMPVFGLMSLALFVFLAFSIVSLLNSGAILGWTLPAGIPLWAGILILVVMYHLVMSPIRAARHASYSAWGPHYGWFAAWDGLFATALTLVGLWLLYRHMPPVHDLREFRQNLPEAARSLGREISMWFQKLADAPR